MKAFLWLQIPSMPGMANLLWNECHTDYTVTRKTILCPKEHTATMGSEAAKIITPKNLLFQICTEFIKSNIFVTLFHINGTLQVAKGNRNY
jgi:hypothetical protein